MSEAKSLIKHTALDAFGNPAIGEWIEKNPWVRIFGVTQNGAYNIKIVS
jgi:hypothetical protein